MAFIPGSAVEADVVGSDYNVYFRNGDGSLGQMRATFQPTHKDAILTVKEALVAEGDCLTNKATLAVIEGGKDD